MLGTLAIALAVGFFFIGFIASMKESKESNIYNRPMMDVVVERGGHKPKKPRAKTQTRVTKPTSTKPQSQKSTKDPVFEEAKKILVSCGYGAGDAKEMLNKCKSKSSDAGEWVQNAMQQIEL